ncbi:MAG: DUF2769 domain-containing protein [Candidatus Bathyarchaeota archaeon]|nr:MAG: DUF2769 domain-containing protein [Candidatus Bathyarchaeota archaeon]
MSEPTKIAPTEVEKRLKRVESMCICRGCPTYKSLGKEDDHIAYCFPARGRSVNIAEEKGCTCGICPTYAEMKFLTSYYCTRGIEMKQKAAIAEAMWKDHSVWDHLRSRADKEFSPRTRTKMVHHSKGHFQQEQKRSGVKL